VLTFSRTSDDNALRAKVEEAMNVYNEYVKTRADGTEESGAPAAAESGEPNGQASEQKA